MTEVTIHVTKPEVSINSNSISVTINDEQIQNTIIGVPGPQGSPGEGGGSSVITKVAGESLSALRAVYMDENDEAYYADNNDVDTVKKLIGITTTAASMGGNVTIRPFGQLTDASWSWNMAGNTAIFLGSNGAIQQGPPAGSITARLGFALKSDAIFVRIGEYIVN